METYTVEVYEDGDQIWLQNGKMHRLDGPATIYPDGSETWYKEGKIHRLDGPAAIFSDGRVLHYINNVRLSEEEFNKSRRNIITLKLIKEWEEESNWDCPYAAQIVCIYDFKIWYVNGKRHSTYGPAVVGPDGYKAWFIEGVEYTEEEFRKKTQKTVTLEVSQEMADMLKTQLGEL